MTSASDIAADLVAFQAALDAAGTLQGASFTVISPVLVAAEKLSTDLDTAITTLDGQIASGMDTGGDPAALATFLSGQAQTVTNETALRSAQSYTDRMVVNLTWSVGA